eukprot:2996331-Prymnesium_polylepis.2
MQLSKSRWIEHVQFVFEISQKLVCCIKIEAAIARLNDDDWKALTLRLQKLQQTPWARQNTLCCQQQHGLRLRACIRATQIHQASSGVRTTTRDGCCGGECRSIVIHKHAPVEKDGSLEHPPEHVVHVPRIQSGLCDPKGLNGRSDRRRGRNGREKRTYV